MLIKSSGSSSLRKRVSANRMSKRMVASDEMDLNYSLDIEAEKAAYLRRKLNGVRGSNISSN